jgi:quinol monooxygenase YgiN
MVKAAIWAELNAKPGKEKELEEFLKSAQSMAERETQTVSWYAVKMSPNSFGIFDTFADDAGRKAHMNGEIAKSLMAKAHDLLSGEPKMHQIEVIASKTGASASRTAASRAGA